MRITRAVESDGIRDIFRPLLSSRSKLRKSVYISTKVVINTYRKSSGRQHYCLDAAVITLIGEKPTLLSSANRKSFELILGKLLKTANFLKMADKRAYVRIGK